MCDLGGGEELGAEQGKRHDYRGSNTRKALLSSTWTWLNMRGSPLQHGTVQRFIAQETLSRRRGGQGNSQGRGGLGRGSICLDNVPQQHNGESLGQRAPSDRSSLEPYNHRVLSYQWPVNTGCSFTGYANLMGPKWLKIFFFGLF